MTTQRLPFPVPDERAHYSTRDGRRDHPGVHAQQALDHRGAAGLLSSLPDHRVERILRVLDPTPGRVQLFDA